VKKIMEIWFLIFWSATVPEFEGGQYQSEERCVAAALYQVEALKPKYGRLHWRCDFGLGRRT